jgi:predicted transposase YbfD/YdcC
MASDAIDGIRLFFGQVQDPRRVASCDHRLMDIIVITILAVLCGADGWEDVALFGRCRSDWLKQFLALPNGIPSHDTFGRVFGLLDPKQFAACLVKWTTALQEASRGRLVSIDGKTLRRSFATRSGPTALHLVSAWATDNGLTLGQVAVAEKSNEITAIPELLQLLDLKGCTVTTDAMGCQKEIATQIRQQKGQYVLALKGNQPTLEADLHRQVEQGLETNFAGVRHDTYETTESGHGRQDYRAYYALEVPADSPHRAEWPDLRTVAAVVSQRVVDGQEQWETRLYISSLPCRAKPLAAAIRRHWGIENSLHWVLDVAFREDDSRMRAGHSAKNFAAVRRLAVSLLRREQTTKNGAKGKRLKAALDPNYLLTVLRTP